LSVGRLLASAAAAVALLFGSQASAAQPQHAGRWIVDGSGRALVLHGFNMVSKLPPYLPSADGFGSDDAAFLARNGFNVVRLGVIYGAVEPSPGHYDDAYLSAIASTVRKLGKRGVYTLLDFHQDMYNERFHGEGFPAWAVQDDGLPNQPDLGFPGNYLGMPALQHAFDHLWADSAGPGGVGLQERYAAAWGHVAERFAGNAHVLGYDLFNEPWPGTNFAPCVGPSGCPAFDAQLGALQAKSIAAIRAADRRHVVWYEPDVLFNQGGTPTRLPKFSDRRLGMSFHNYCLGGPPQICAKGERGAFANAVKRSRATGDGLMLTEFGATNDEAANTRVASEADDALMPWIEWAYCACGDPTTSANPPSEEAVVVDPKRAPRGSNVVAPTLRALERPYPQVVAGTPRQFGFDPGSGVFKLRYSTVRPSRHGRFRAGSCTQVFVPALQYPHGYRARVRGARVVSRRGAGLLELRSRARARTVRLTVTPRKHGHTGRPRVTGGCGLR
jgi:endoglycosylceramidase